MSPAHLAPHALLFQAVLHTERFRFWPLSRQLDAAADTQPLRHALSAVVPEDNFAKARSRIAPCVCACYDADRARANLQHLAYEDLCFVAEKDMARRNCVFADQTGASWSELASAALKPIGACARRANACCIEAHSRAQRTLFRRDCCRYQVCQPKQPARRRVLDAQARSQRVLASSMA